MWFLLVAFVRASSSEEAMDKARSAVESLGFSPYCLSQSDRAELCRNPREFLNKPEAVGACCAVKLTDANPEEVKLLVHEVLTEHARVVRFVRMFFERAELPDGERPDDSEINEALPRVIDLTGERPVINKMTAGIASSLESPRPDIYLVVLSYHVSADLF